MSKWYQELYENFDTYGEEPYVQNTIKEVDFVEHVLHLNRSIRILDLGCGNGRHSLELARRGYSVTGIDLSDSMLEQGRQVAASEGLQVNFIACDARKIDFHDQFDVIIMLCEGAFSLMEEDDMDVLILHNIFQALTPGGKLVMTLPNAAMMLCKEPNESFDTRTCRESFAIEKAMPDGSKKILECTQRYYTCPELGWILKHVSFKNIEFFACTDIGYDLHEKPNKSHFEFGAIAVK